MNASTHTDDQLRHALIRALPDKLEYALFNDESDSEDGEDGYFHWLEGDDNAVTPHEWDSIVRMVEAGLNHKQKSEYLACRSNNGAKPVSAWAFDPWAVCAKYLAEIGAITIP